MGWLVEQVTKYVQPTRDGEIEQWRVTYADGGHEDLESFEVGAGVLVMVISNDNGVRSAVSAFGV